MDANPEKISEYKVFKVKYLEDDNVEEAHDIFVKKYTSATKSTDRPSGKTISVLNIPPYVTKELLRKVFSIAGEIIDVALFSDYKNDQKYSVPSKFFDNNMFFKYSIGIIVYKKSSSVHAVFLLDTLPALYKKDEQNNTGIKKWIEIHNKKIIHQEELQREIDDYMMHYDKIKSVEDHESSISANEEGWIQVGKKGFKQHEAVVHRLEEKLESQKKKARRNLHQFSGMYGFEIRENKKQELLELKKKFEEDKSKLQSMRQNRKFKPY